MGEPLTTASGRNFVRGGVWSARRKSQWLFLSEKRAAALGKQPKQASSAVRSRAD
jgi:hypothetical protein